MSPSCWFVFSDLIFKKPSTVYTVRSNQRAPSLGGCQGCPAKWYNGLWVSPFGACSDPLQVLFWAFTFLLYCLALLHLSSWQSDSPSPQVKASLSPLFPEVWTSVRLLYWRNNLIIRTRKKQICRKWIIYPCCCHKMWKLRWQLFWKESACALLATPPQLCYHCSFN